MLDVLIMKDRVVCFILNLYLLNAVEDLIIENYCYAVR